MFSSAHSVLAIWGIGPTELIIILVILLLLFGGAKLPGLARGLGQSIKEFKNAAKENAADEDETPTEKKTVTRVKKSENN